MILSGEMLIIVFVLWNEIDHTPTINRPCKIVKMIKIIVIIVISTWLFYYVIYFILNSWWISVFLLFIRFVVGWKLTIPELWESVSTKLQEVPLTINCYYSTMINLRIFSCLCGFSSVRPKTFTSQKIVKIDWKWNKRK